ncbi:MAG: tetratricopeptide repeat protein [Mucilaginibacter polytrichastri]|nr:tetratricopeptide repeat protein [Mucilaginibacter polytrichastri]
MKRQLFVAGIFCMTASLSAFAQKSELNKAKAEFEKYTQTANEKTMAAVSENSLKAAKESIDKAAAHDKTKDLPETFAYKAAIEAAYASKDSTGGGQNFTAADADMKKAKELDKDGKNKQVIETAGLFLAQSKLNEGVKAYDAKDFEKAYKAFNYYRTILPEDTNAIYYTGLAAINAKKYDEAIPHYQKLLTTGFTKKQQLYNDLSAVYLMKKDTANALKVISEGAAKFPKDAVMKKREIEISLQTGKTKELTDKINAALVADPNDKTMHYYAGLIESEQKHFDKAAEHYKKAIEIDPNYAEAYVNMGYVLITPGIEMFNEANKLPQNKQKEYAAAKAKAMAYFEKAKPYLDKGVELNPKSTEALNNLKTYYLAKNDTKNANDVQQKIDAIGGGR